MLAGLTSLGILNLAECSIRRFVALECLLPTLKILYLYGCKLDDLPSEVCGENSSQNVLDKVRAHYEDLKSGKSLDAEVKVLFLGNGTTGKSQLCRRFRREPFDPSVPTTHGILLSATTITLEGFDSPVRLNFWDFGGQEIYHGSHALFLQAQSVFLILWTPELERQTLYQEGDLAFRHRPLYYWLDYLRAFAGVDSPVLLIQSQCDTPVQRTTLPQADVDDFTALQQVQVSAKTSLGFDLVAAALKEGARHCLYRRPPPRIGTGRVKVRDGLRQLLAENQSRSPKQRRHRLLERSEFDQLCQREGGISDKEAVLDYLHHNGVIFYRTGLFGGRIVLDQNWALQAIYAVFDRKKTLPLLRGYGRFSRADLEALVWSDYAFDEQRVFLGMMESCGICFRARELPDGEWEYIAPELLPRWSEAQEQLLGRLRDDPPDATATARYGFLHEGILRGYLSKLGDQAKDAAIYWKYGCWFYEQKTRSQVLIESGWVDAANEAGAGNIWFRAWGENSENLIDKLLDALRKLPIGQAPKIEQTKRIRIRAIPLSDDAVSSSLGATEIGDKADGLNQLQITARPDLPPKGKPEIFVSYAWGDDSSDDARKRTEVVERLCETLRQDGWNILRDKTDMLPGDLISGFMKRIGLADHVIVVLSDKYLRSPYCMTELHSIYQRSVGEKEDFLRRIIPLVLAGARISTSQERVKYSNHWETEYLELKAHLDYLSVEDFRFYRSMQDWYNHVGNMLTYVNDVLHPHEFDEIVKDDFAALRQMLEQRR